MKTVCGSDEPHSLPVRSLTYRTEQAMANEARRGDRVYDIKIFVNQNQCLVSFKSSSGIRASPTVYLENKMMIQTTGQQFKTKCPFCFLFLIQGVSKRALQLWKLIEIYTEDIHSIVGRRWPRRTHSLPARRCTPSLPWRSARVSQHPFPRSVDR